MLELSLGDCLGTGLFREETDLPDLVTEVWT